MAKSNSPAEQLDIAKSLLAVTQQMAAAVDAVNKKQMDQVQIMTQIQDAMKAMDTKGLIASVDAATKAINELTARLSNLGKTSQQTLGDMSGQAKQAGASVTVMATAVTQAGNAALTASNSTSKLSSAVQNNTKNTQKAIETWGDFQKSLKDRFPKATLFASSALSGLSSAFGAVKAGVGFAIDAFKQIIGTVFEVGKAILALPFNFLDTLTQKANKMAGGTNEWFEAVQEVKDAFGSVEQTAPSALISMAKNSESLANTGVNARRVWGSLGEQLKAFNELAKEMGPLFDSFADEFRETGKQLPAFAKGLGLGGEEMRSLAAHAKSTGMSMTSLSITFTKQSLALSKQFGVSAKLISKDMAKALGDVKHFGGATVKQIATASVYARKLGLELDKITGTLDAFETFEGAADNASKLSQAFGVQVDAFKMMEAQDPAQQIDMLRKSFAAAGKDASSFNRQQLSLLASATGLDEATAKQAFSMKNQGVSLDKINKKSDEAEKRQIDQTKALRELADAMKLVSKSGSSEGGFLDKFLQGVTQGFERTAEFRGLMHNMVGTFGVLRGEGRRLGAAIMESFPGMKMFFGGLKDIFDPKKFSKLAGGVVDELIKFFKEFMSGKYSFKQLMENITGPGGVFDKFMGSQGESGKKVVEGFKTMWKFVTKVTAEAIKWLSEKVASGIKYIGRLISGKEKITDSGAGSFLAETLGPIWEALKDAWGNIKPVLMETLSEIGDSIMNWLKEKLLPMLGDMAPSLLGSILGGAALKGLLSVAMAGFGKMLTGALTGTVTEAGKAAATAASGTLQQTAATVAQQVAPAVQAPVAAAAKEAASNAGPDLFSQLAQEREAEIAQRKTAGEKLHGAAKASQAGKTGNMEKQLAEARAAATELDAKDQIAEAKKKMADAPDVKDVSAGPVDKVTELKESSDKLMETEKKSKWGGREAAALGLKLVAIAAALAVGGVLLALAVLAIAKIVGGLSMEELAKALVTLAVTVVLALPLMMALKLAEKQSAGSILKGAIAMAIGVGAMGLVAAGLVLLAQQVGSADWDAIGQLLVVMAALTLMSIPLLAAMWLAGKAANPVAVVLGAVVIALGVVAMALTALEVVDTLSGLNAQDVENAAKMLDSISMAFLMMVPILLGAGVIGAIIIGSLGIGAAFIAEGMAAMALGVMEVANTAVDILKKLQEANLSSSTGPAIDSFLKVMEVVVKMFDSIGGMFSTLLDQDFDDASQAAEMMDKGKAFIDSLIGSPGSKTGIIGIAETIMDAVKQIKTDELGPSAEVFVNLLGAIPGIMQGLQPSPDFYKACDELGGDADEIGPMTDGATRMIAATGQAVEGMIRVVGREVRKLLQLPMPDAEKAKGVGAILSGLGGLISALAPDPKLMESFKTTTESSWGIGGGTSIDIGKVTEFLSAYLGAMSLALPKISGDVITQIIGAMQGLSPEQISKMAGIGEILQALGGLIGALSAAQKSNPIKMVEMNAGGVKMMVPMATTIGDVIGSIGELPTLMGKVIGDVKKIAEQMPPGTSGDIFEKQIKTVAALFTLLKAIPELSAAVAQGSTFVGKKDGKEHTYQNPMDMKQSILKVHEVLKQMVDSGADSLLPPLMTTVQNIYKFLTQYNGGTNLSKVADLVTKFFENLKKLTESITSIGAFGEKKKTKEGKDDPDDPGVLSKTITAMTNLHVALGIISPYVGGIVGSIRSINAALSVINPEKAMGAVNKFFSSFSDFGGALTTITTLDLPPAATVQTKFGQISGSLDSIAKSFGKNAVPTVPGGKTLAQVDESLQNVDMTRLRSIAANFTDLTGHIKKIKSGFDSVTGDIDKTGLLNTMEALNTAIEKVNTMNQTLKGINAGEIQIKTGLKTLATGLGIGGSNDITVKNKAVEITMHVHVDLHAGMVEKAIVLRSDSIIRDRLNFATQNPGLTGVQGILPGVTPADLKPQEGTRKPGAGN